MKTSNVTYRNTVEIVPLFPCIEQNLQIVIKIKRGIRKNEFNSKANKNYTKVNKLILLTEFFAGENLIGLWT